MAHHQSIMESGDDEESVGLSSSDGSENSHISEAGHVYLLMKKDYRISRNIRAHWYFNNLNTIIRAPCHTKTSLDDFSEELEIVSVIPAAEGDGGSEPTNSLTDYKLTTNTTLTFFAHQYRLVFALDLSPSIGVVESSGDNVVYGRIFNALRHCLQGITSPFHVSGSSVVFLPQIYITIIAHTPCVASKAEQVLVQGHLLTSHNLHQLLSQVHAQLERFENSIADALALQQRTITTRHAAASVTGTSGGHHSAAPPPPPHSHPPLPVVGNMDGSTDMVTPDIGMVNMLRYGILALQLLPENTCAGIIVLTDGILGLPDASMFESLLTQLRNNAISCSFIGLSGDYHADCALGHVPYSELMSFIATATFGAYLPTTLLQDEVAPSTGGDMNIYHRSFFTWTFQHPPPPLQLHSPQRGCLSEVDMLTKKHYETVISASLLTLLSLRLREGYTVKSVTLTNPTSAATATATITSTTSVTSASSASSSSTSVANTSQQQLGKASGGGSREGCEPPQQLQRRQLIRVELVLPWKYSSRIEYRMTSAWPLTVEQSGSASASACSGSSTPAAGPSSCSTGGSSMSSTTTVGIYVSGNYEFLHDVMCSGTKRANISTYRVDVVNKFKHALHSLSQTDKLLEHLQSFTHCPAHYTLL